MQHAVGNADTVAEISVLLGTEVGSLKSEFSVYFERLLEETARLVDQATDKGLHRNIRNASFRQLWRDYFSGGGETIRFPTFVMGVENFMTEMLYIPEDDVAELWNEDTQASVQKAIDRNGDGKVSTCNRVDELDASFWMFFLIDYRCVHTAGFAE